METNEIVRRGGARASAACALAMAAAFVALAARGAPVVEPPTLVDGSRVERSMPGNAEDRLVVDASAGPLVVVLDQLDTDVVLRCANEAHARNAQTGRWGPEVVVVDKLCKLSVRARSVGTPTMTFRMRAFAFDSAEGRRLPRRIWELWSQAHYDGGSEDAAGNASALAKLGEVERAVAALGDSDDRRYLQLGNAQLLRRLGRHEEAIVAYDAFLRTLDPARHAVWIARASNGKGLSLRELDHFDEADRVFVEAERHAADGRDPYEWVSAKNNRCLTMHHHGRLAAARDCYAAVIPHYRKFAPNQVAVPMVNLAAAADALGEPAVALRNYRAVLELRRAGADRRSLGQVLVNLAGHEAQTGAWQDALEHSLEAQRVFESLGDKPRIAEAWNLRGWIYAELRELKRSREYFEESLRVALDSKDPGTIGMAKAALAVLEPDDARAAAAHREAVDYLVQTRQDAFASREWIMLAERLDAMRDVKERDAALAAAEKLLSSNGSRTYRARAAMLRGRVALRDGRLADATASATYAIALRTQARETDGLAAARLLKARIERRAGRADAGLAEIERALDELRRAERLPSSPVLAANLYDRRVELLDEAMDILLGGERRDAALEHAWTLKWKYARLPSAPTVPADADERELLDELRAKVLLLSGARTPGVDSTAPPSPQLAAELARRVEEIESQLDARRVRVTGAHGDDAMSLTEVQRALQPDEALVAINLGATTSGVWISGSERTQWVALPPRAALIKATEAVLKGLDVGAYDELSRAFAPVFAATRDARRVLLVPDGPSHLIPFAGLRDDTGSYWIERSSIVLLDGPPTSPEQLRPIALARDFPVVVWGAERRAAEGELTFDGDKPQYRAGVRMEELPAVSIEMRLMERVLGGTRVIAGDPQAIDAPSGAQHWMLHVAGHGLASGSHPYATALALPSANGSGGFAFMSGSLVQLGSRPPSIVFVNVCEGFSGRLFESQPPSSLARQFLQAGAGVVIAASWPIEDTRAARFAERLYEELDKNPGDVAEAVARAQRKALQAGGARGLRYWSGYSVVRRG